MQLYLVMFAKRMRKGTWSDGERERKTHREKKHMCVRQTEREGCRERREKKRRGSKKGRRNKSRKRKRKEGELEKERKERELRDAL